jgi:hypothetical protein
VVLFDAPPTIGHNIQRAIDQIASRTRVSNEVTHIVYGNNSWAAVQAYQAAQVDYAAAPVIKKYTGVLAAADVYTASTAFMLLESIRLDQGFGSQIHP